MNKVIRFVFFLGLTIVPALAFPQNKHPHFTHITTRDGLLSNIVYSIFQDKTGFLWLGSYNCLTRYDGYTFKHYQHEPGDSSSLPKGVVMSISEDTDGNMWLVNIYGMLIKFDPRLQRFTIIPYRKGEINKHNMATAVACDGTGNAWVKCDDSTLKKISTATGKIQNYHLPVSCLTVAPALTTVLSVEKEIWWGTNKYNPQADRFECLLRKEEFSDRGEYINSIVRDSSGNIWLAIWTQLFKYNPQKKILQRIDSSVTRITRVAIDNVRQALWYTEEGVGIKRLDLKTGAIDRFTPDFRDPNSLSHAYIHALYCDRQGNVWIATDKELNKLSSLSQVFKQYELDPEGQQGLSQPIIRAMHLDEDGILWLGTRGGGLNRVQLKPEVKYRQILLEPRSNSYGRNFINCISPFKPHKLLVGTQTALFIFDTRREQIEERIPIPANDRLNSGIPVWAALADTGNRIWFGNQNGGLFIYDLGSRKILRITEYQKAIGREFFNGEAIWNLFKDSKGQIWASTHFGIMKLGRNAEGGIKVKLYTENTSDPNGYKGEDAWQIYEDKKGIFWIATLGGGLHRFDPITEKFRNYTVKNGLPSNEICGILEDERGTLWVSTLKGIFTFDKEEERVLNTYFLDDGLQGDHFGFRVCAKAKDGELFFGGQNGFNSFYPENISNTSSRPTVVLTQFRSLYEDRTRDLLKAGGMELSYTQSTISFDFAILDLTNPNRNIFRYYLDGVDKTWSPPTTAHSANYNFLPPGKYTFHVMGATNPTHWSKPVSFMINILPPFWKRLWFLLTAGALALAIVGFILYSINKQQREKRKRLQSELTALRAQLNPHFIFNSLASLQNFITENQQLLALEYLSKFATLIRMILHNSRHAFVSLSEELKFLELYTYMESVRYQNRIQFKIHIAPGTDVDRTRIPPMIVQPLVENSIKHGLLGTHDRGEVDVYFSADENYVYCRVEDNGVGLSQAEENKRQRSIAIPSLSTSIIRERIEMLKDRGGNRGSLSISDIVRDGEVKGVRTELAIPQQVNIPENILV